MAKDEYDENRRFRLGVVIVNYRTPALVEACLASLARQLEEVEGACVVVDNASGDGSFERLCAWREIAPARARMKVVAAPGNGGFSAGNNIGFENIRSEFVLLLNSDAEVRPGALKALLAAAEAAPAAGVFTPKIVSSDGAPQVSRFRRHSLASEFVDGAQTGPVTRLLPHGETPIFPDDVATDPAWVSFAAVMIRRAAIDRAGPMDEGFFLYYEDCDYCRRLTRRGAEIRYVPAAVFVHDAGGSTKLSEKQDEGARLPAYYYRSRARYFRKVYGPAGPFLANIAWLAGRLIALMRGVVGRPAPQLSRKRYADIWLGWLGGGRA